MLDDCGMIVLGVVFGGTEGVVTVVSQVGRSKESILYAFTYSSVLKGVDVESN